MSGQRLPLKFNVADDSTGHAVEITGGRLSGRSATIVTVEDRPLPQWILIELDRDGGNAWIEIDHLSLDVELNSDRFRMRPTILKFIENCAEGDLRKARKHGSILIAQTVRGTVELAYERATYTLTTQDGGTWRKTGKRASVKPELINLYSVQEDEESRQLIAEAKAAA